MQDNDSEKLVPVGMFNDHFQAQLFTNYLINQGIDAFIFDADGASSHVSSRSGTKVVVRESDARKSKALLILYEKS